MKVIVGISVLTVLLLAPFGQCFAMMSVGKISKERAKALGIELRAKPNGPNEAWIELEFNPEGELADYNHVSLEVRDDDKFMLGWTPLKDERLGTGHVIVRVMGNRDFLENVTLRIVTGTFGESGDDLRIKDFVDLKKLR